LPHFSRPSHKIEEKVVPVKAEDDQRRKFKFEEILSAEAG
jgi:hypothetical protein